MYTYKNITYYFSNYSFSWHGIKIDIFSVRYISISMYRHTQFVLKNLSHHLRGYPEISSLNTTMHCSEAVVTSIEQVYEKLKTIHTEAMKKLAESYGTKVVGK